MYESTNGDYGSIRMFVYIRTFVVVNKTLAKNRHSCYSQIIGMMGIGTKFIVKVLLNGLGLYLASAYIPGFHLYGGIKTLAISAVLLALLYTVIRPFLRLITAPLVWVTFGLFNIAINMALLWGADRALPELAIDNITTLFYVSIIIAVVNIF